MAPEIRPRPIDQLLKPFDRFVKLEAASGILLLACTLAALGIANSPWAESYAAIAQTKLTLMIADFGFSKPLLLWINDGLMAVFFFVIGLEIKRELMEGELASLRQSALPVLAAVGGMIFPAAIFAFFNHGGDGAHGWGIPMATDIAFAIGILALLGNRIPTGLKVFLTAVAIVDDLGAVLVIAFFYTASISWTALGAGAAFLALLALANLSGVRRPGIYLVLGFALWAAFVKSGVHATIAGVLLAMTIPTSRRIDQTGFYERVRALIDRFGKPENMSDPRITEDQHTALIELEETCENLETPSKKMEHRLHPWVSFLIMPLFALANAGVSLGGDLASAIRQPVTIGVIFGLVLGKQIGITLFSLLPVKLGWATLPQNTSLRQIYGVAWLGGIGFTMSLFIGSLAFTDPALLYAAKLGILTASLISGVVGFVLLRVEKK